MSHLDPDRLILLALDEQAPDSQDVAHLDTCPTCQAELAATRQVAALGRESKAVADLPPPPAGLWDRIADEAFGPPPRPAAQVPAPRRAGSMGRRAVAFIAAGAFALGLVGGLAADRLLRPDTGTGTGREVGQVIAQADLTPQPGAPPGAHGLARVIDTGQGLQLTVTVEGVPAVTGYYTVWLYDGGDVMIPIGSPGSAPLNVPAAARDLDLYRIIDVSAQNLGQQQHGRSVLQGALRR